jgi:hypothetical protein
LKTLTRVKKLSAKTLGEDEHDPLDPPEPSNKKELKGALPTPRRHLGLQ